MPPKKTNDFLIILPLWLITFGFSCQLIIIAPILPRIKETLRVSDPLLGLLGAIYAVVLCVMALIAGPISDRIGRRRILLIGSGSLAMALTMHVFASTYWLLFTMRSLAGIGAGILTGAILSYIGDYFPYEKRGWITGWVMSGTVTGNILGIPLGTILADIYNYQMPFVAFGGLLVIAWVLLWFFVPQPNNVYDQQPLTLKRVLRRYMQLLAQRHTLGGVLGYIVNFLSFGLFFYYFAAWLETDIGLSPGDVASLFLVGGFAGIIINPIAGRLSDRIGPKLLIVLNGIAGVALMAFTTVWITDLTDAYIVFALGLCVGGMRLIPYQTLMTELVPAEKRGSLLSLANSLGQLSFGVGGLIAGLTYATYGYASNTYGAAAILLLIVFIVFYMLPEESDLKNHSQ